MSRRAATGRHDITTDGVGVRRGHGAAVAWCDIDNLPSRRVLERLGFALVETVDGEHRFTLDLGNS